MAEIPTDPAALLRDHRDWRGYFPRGVLDPLGPSGEPITTSTDRRLLWHIELALSGLPTSESGRKLQNALASYLHETCRHHWGTPWPGDETFAAHRQCLWCNHVDWLTEHGPQPLTVEPTPGRPGAEERTCVRCGEEYTEPLSLIGGQRFCPRDVACRVEAELRAAEVRHAG